VTRFISSATGLTIITDPTDDPAQDLTGNDHYFINYTDNPVAGSFNIYASGLLTETGIRSFEPEVRRQDDQILLFPAPAGFDLPFDLLSAVFFFLARYEEYLPFSADRHDRFEAVQSLAFRHGFLDEPVVDQWTEMFKTALVNGFHGLKFPEQEFRFVSTIDVDNPWAYLHKGFFKTAGGLFSDLLHGNLTGFRKRLNVLLGKNQDPYDTYDYILKTERTFGFTSVFFFLTGAYGHYDTNYALTSGEFRNLLNKLKTERSIGMHPSYRSNRNSHLLKFEYDRFTRFLGHKPAISRQHFLVLKFPYTCRNLIKLGIQDEYSMGYASCTGFRAGTSRSFRFYDLDREYETHLVFHPFVVMDVALQQYLALTPQEASSRIDELIEKVREVNGTFTSLWHNESLSEEGVWKGWREVFERMVKKAMNLPDGRQAMNNEQ
jgi:hypothetical protein